MMRDLIRLLCVALLLALVIPAPAATGTLSSDPGDRRSTIPHDEDLARALRDSDIRRIAVRHEGWNETLSSWARIKLNELTGRQSIHGQDPTYTVLSLVFERERWYEADFLPIEHPDIASTLGLEGKWASPRDFLENPGLATLQARASEAQLRRQEMHSLERLLRAAEQVYKLGADRTGVFEAVAADGLDAAEVRRLSEDQASLDSAHERLRAMKADVAREKALLSACEKLFHRLQLGMTLREQLLVTPDPEAPGGDWLSAESIRAAGAPRGVAGADSREVPGIVSASIAGDAAAPLALASGLQQAALGLDSALEQAFREADGSRLREAVGEFLSIVERSRHYPSEQYLAVKELYTRHNPYMITAWVYGLAAVLLGLHAFFRSRPWWIAGVAVLAAGFVLQTAAMGMRLYLTGHMPVSNMFESIIFAAWSALALGVGFEAWKRQGLFGLVAAIVGFVALLGVTQMPLHDSRIHPLRAVLNSYWLNIHVTAMLISYGAFMIACVLAIFYLVKWGWLRLKGREQFFGSAPLMPLEQIELLAYRLVQVGWPILTVGIMLGAVWADTAWGRYWGWDPKETWALITWITYTMYLHARMVMGKSGHVSAILCVVGFVMVMITWLGVSYLPWFAGGLHTYASPT